MEIDINNSDLLQRIKLGDEKAFDTLYRAYYEKLCRFSYAIIHEYRAAEEIVDDVMLNVWNNHLNLQIETLFGYLVKAVRNNSIKLIKSTSFQHNNHLVSLSEDGLLLWHYISNPDSPIGWIIEKEMEDKLQAIISSLPVETRRVFKMSREENMTYKEIANTLGLSTDTVKYHIKRALKIIRTEMPYTLFIVFLFQYFGNLIVKDVNV